MTRLDTARETADKARETLAPYAATAKETALTYAEEARHRIGPHLEAIGPKASEKAGQAAQAARVQYAKHLAPQLEHAFGALPPHAQQSTLKAVHRAQEAALSAKLSAGKAVGQARGAVLPRVADARAALGPAAQEAQNRGAAALTALQGHVSSAEISDLAARNVKREQHPHRGRGLGLALTGVLTIAAGLAAWKWWRGRGEPEWLVEPPAAAREEEHLNGASAAPKPGPPPGRHAAPAPGPAPEAPAAPEDHPKGSPVPDDRPKPHDPRKPH
ncbi:DUF5324 family protein [Kitasatospora albolonga]|uniref:DUF5324 family protein n=1 Tax=Kitasatospora albolonga TaxID=68173 RepID=UPI0031E53664